MQSLQLHQRQSGLFSSRRSTAPRSARRWAPCQALFQFNFPSLQPKQQSGIAEKPLYRPNEMVQMGPFKVAPMGFGTWSWGETSWPVAPVLGHCAVLHGLLPLLVNVEGNSQADETCR